MMSILFGMIALVTIFTQDLLGEHYVVRQSKDISNFEKSVLEKRFPIIKETVQKFVGSLEDRYVPSIAVATSGGGCRATIASLAFVDALNDLGFLNACSHLSTLSGSTWMLGALLAHRCSPKELKNYLQSALAPTTKDFNKTACIFEFLRNKYINYNQAITLTDIFGCVLAYMFLTGLLSYSPLEFHFSAACDTIRSGHYPFPLFTAMLDGVNPREFIEISPWEVGSTDYLASWVETTAFGKKFDAGESGDIAPEQSLGFLMGICSSAYAFGFYDAMKFILKKLREYWNWVSSSNDGQYKRDTDFIDQLIALEKNLPDPTVQNVQNLFQTAARVNNFTQGLEGCPTKDIDQLVLIDAGMGCNLPFAPLLAPARNVGLYIVCDVSSGPKSEVIKDLEANAQRKGYKLPKFDYKKIDNDEICFFYDQDDPTVPVIVYIPHSADNSTLKFSYSEAEFNALYDSIKNRVDDAKSIIQGGIRIAVGNAKRRLGVDTGDTCVGVNENPDNSWCTIS